MIRERLVIVLGNCQAHYLAAILAAQGLGLVCIVGQPFGFHPVHRGVRPLFIETGQLDGLAAAARANGRQVVILEQTSPVHPGLDPAVATLADRVIGFPHLEAQALWPHLSGAEHRHDPQRIRRRWALDLAAMRRSEAKAGWNGALCDFIEQSHADLLLFPTFNHPGAHLMSRLHAGLCDRLEADGGLDPVARARAGSDIWAAGGLSFMFDHPVHPAVIEALDLRWARAPWYAAWAASVEAAAAMDFARARAETEAALASAACDPHVFYTYGLVLEALGERGLAHEAFGRAHRAYPQNPEYANRWLIGLRPSPDDPPHPAEPALRATYPGFEPVPGG